MENYAAVLIPSRANGQTRKWAGEAADWDDACERAEADNPGWTVHTCGIVRDGVTASVWAGMRND